MYKKILCPVDGSATSNCGMMEAIHLAKDQNAKLRFLHVIDVYFPIMAGAGDFNVVYMDDMLREYGKIVLKKAEIAAHKAGIEVDVRTVEAIGGRVSKFVMQQVKEWPADLIVMGTHGLRGIERLVLGSDAETIVRTSLVPVLLVREKLVDRKTQ